MKLDAISIITADMPAAVTFYSALGLEPNCYPTAAQQPGARLLGRRRVVLSGADFWNERMVRPHPMSERSSRRR